MEVVSAGPRLDEVWLVALDPTSGAEIRKTRPCLIISPDEMNQHLQAAIIAPMTTTERPYPTRVAVAFQGKRGQVASTRSAPWQSRAFGAKIGNRHCEDCHRRFYGLGRDVCPAIDIRIGSLSSCQSPPNIRFLRMSERSNPTSDGRPSSYEIRRIPPNRRKGGSITGDLYTLRSEKRRLIPSPTCGGHAGATAFLLQRATEAGKRKSSQNRSWHRYAGLLHRASLPCSRRAQRHYHVQLRRATRCDLPDQPRRISQRHGHRRRWRQQDHPSGQWRDTPVSLRKAATVRGTEELRRTTKARTPPSRFRRSRWRMAGPAVLPFRLFHRALPPIVHRAPRSTAGAASSICAIWCCTLSTPRL